MYKRQVIVAQAPPVVVAGDTTAYNASAYRVNEGAALEELVKKLSGAEINEDGKLTINGEEIKNYRQESDIKNLNILSKRITNGKHLIIHSERKLI